MLLRTGLAGRRPPGRFSDQRALACIWFYWIESIGFEAARSAKNRVNE